MGEQTSTADITRKHLAPELQEYTCQSCGCMFHTSNTRALYCSSCEEMKTEPPGLQAAPSPFREVSIAQVGSSSQQQTPNPENGKPVAVPPRLRSVPFDHEQLTDQSAQIGELGTTAIYPTPPTIIRRKDLVLSAFRLLETTQRIYLRDFSSEDPVLDHGKTGWPHRSCFCYHSVVPGLVGVELRRSEDGQTAALGGVVHCGSIWMCPVCQLYSSLRWQKETKACEEALRADGYRLLLCVLTISHNTGTSLQEEIDILRAAYTELFSNQKKSQKKRSKRWGIVGRMRAWDVLYGVNGWHAHMNVTIAIAPGTRDYDIEEIHQELDRVYRLAVDKAGGFASSEHGLSVTEYKNGKAYSIRTGMEGIESRRVGDKFALAYEMISTDEKSQHGLSIGQLRLAASRGYSSADLTITPEQAQALCLEYAATMTGERSVICAAVIRDKMKEIGKCEASSEEDNSAPDLENTQVLGILHTEDYHREIVGHNRFVELLTAIRDGPVELDAFLAGIGIVLERRDKSLQANAVFSHTMVDVMDREDAVVKARKEVERWGILNVEIDSSDLDDFL